MSSRKRSTRGSCPGQAPLSLCLLYVEDVDSVYQQALAAGATSERGPEDMFYGDRSAGLRDAFGNRWWIHTNIEDVPAEEMGRRQAAMAQS